MESAIVTCSDGFQDSPSSVKKVGRWRIASASGPEQARRRLACSVRIRILPKSRRGYSPAALKLASTVLVSLGATVTF